MDLPGRIHSYLWNTEMMLLADFLTASSHHHSAVQVMVGIEAQMRFEFAGQWHDVSGVVIGPNVPHAFDGTAGLMAGGWVEAEATVGEALRQLLPPEGWVALPAEAASQVADYWEPCLDPSTACDVALARWRDGLGVLVGDAAVLTAIDPRLLPAIAHLRDSPTPTPTMGQLAEMCHLSESHFQHLFRDQVGVPPVRYLLWHRVLDAMELMGQDITVTEAAHRTGFADGAHLTRTTRTMTGTTPSELSRIIRNASTLCR